MCQEGWVCERIIGGGIEGSFCFPADFCLDRDNDGYGIGPNCLGPDCDDDDPDVHFNAVSLCDGKDNNCNDIVDDNPVFGFDAAGERVRIGELCTSDLPGRCAQGTWTCMNGDTLCAPLFDPREERCNGEDDSCDGVIDGVLDTQGNIIPLTRDCYTGPADTEGFGLCRGGVQTCTGGEWSSVCEGEVRPATEICDGQDNACSGAIDDDPDDVGRLCTTDVAEGPCSTGRTICVEGELRCEPLAEPGAEELCNGVDDTCDGLVDMVLDENNEPQPLTRTCYTGPEETRNEGECREGFRVCEEGEYSETCFDQVLPQAETCNGRDDSCNGEIDADPAGVIGVGEPCTVEGQLGACAEGITVCTGGEIICEQVNFPQAEICDGVDRSCNGEIDGDSGGVQGVGMECSVPGLQGPCATGALACIEGALTCQQTVFPEPVETCNGRDDTCSGQVDGDPAGVQGVGAPCTVPGLLGNCAQGVQVCQNGGLVCQQTIFPQTETCNNQDQSCDGVVDGTAAAGQLTQSCYSGRPGSAGTGICRAGTQTCNNGVWGVCEGEVVPRVERCNGLDESCNGAVDVDLDGRVACPAGCFGRFNGATGFRGGYMFCQLPPGYTRRQDSARSFCNAQGMNLVQIDNADANVWVRNQPGFNWGEAWIGLQQVGNDNNRYRWPDGTELFRDCGGCPWQGGFTSWRSGEPNSSGEDCVDIRRSDAGWNDVGCSQNRNEFFCSW